VGPPHILGVVILVVLAVAALAGKSLFGAALQVRALRAAGGTAMAARKAAA
jgi:hypothetical protein